MENSNLIETYFKKLNQCGVSECSCEQLKEKYGDLLCVGSYSTTSDSGLAYEGSLIKTALKELAVFAVKINELYPPEIMVDKKNIVKICLLQHISKCVRLTESTDEWRKTKLGEMYTYTIGMPAIGVGLHSLIMASECGVEFTPFESEAMTIIDRKDDDTQAKYHSSLLTYIIKQANEMVYNKYSQLSKQKNQ